ncbi:MAG: hypothetical protein COV55_03455 [Candidatus Komeilibacteria bacterium CG11_big_fil_rev_8_21_14_0_20_36_20]|uniref:RecF/RecN/SMC N-terminal domain-containing protein n=1 Tax=Candidatus Komeilibacteria bacterium CG11_big_fil_rev_8_21_14_0_20_36_20 TaxID=1974477 RepID=A0A2H0NEP6_9BACT|nr:MAG: hypothetical protein COV55_03455 [Candidatus Komeilibacteria bacterium CG11_big_fil_rev_8_21_14_0_20_36_20]PIR81889.1 MAG: hypothetical protein COU21_00900 [Candidatus Komeilibacteria bacterium CG10_big_fil_rev_8_21_14_0_10_36_65]PJC55382.1 MAG: hypothetical protein CO027_02540 [Candidatus Komeilibacteria bacterium CG_4_9_14_0_2_um_filter_36_13]
MYLEKLEIQGFKSFAKPAGLVFNRELTAIVGPNGSGKSNITDAVRWVLGEQSTKVLRGKKSEDVIFAGSDKKGRLGWARVELYLDNRDHAGGIDYDQIIVSRRIDRKGESEYLINNNKVRLLDVQLLLARANFGQKTYSVIGQGMIDSILTRSSTERKEFFDEATGVRQFQIKKEQSINKLTNTKRNLEQSSQIFSELEPRLRGLTRQVNKLEKRERLEGVLKELQTEYYSFLGNNLNQDIQENQKKFEGLQQEVSNLNQQLIELQTQLDKGEQTVSRQESFELLQNKLSQLQNELNSLLKEKTILEGRSDLELIARGQSDLVWLNKRIDDLKNQIDKNNLLLSDKKKSLSKLKKEQALLKEKQKVVLDSFRIVERELTKAEQVDLSTVELSGELNKIFKEQQRFEEDFDQIQTLEDLSKLKKVCAQITKLIESLWQKFSKAEAEGKHDLSREFSRLLKGRDDLTNQINDLRVKLVLLENDIAQLESQLNRDDLELTRLESNNQFLDNLSSGEELVKEQKVLQDQIDVKNQEIEELKKQIQSFNKEEEGKKQVLVQAQKKFRQVQQEFNLKNNELNNLKVVLARLETKQEDLNKEIKEECLDFKIKDKVSRIDLEETRQKINNTKNQLQIIGGIDQTVVEEYKEVKERYDFLKEQTDDLDKAINHLEKLIKDLDQSISSQFDASFRNINKLFDKYFKKLFDGGRAELILNIIEETATEDENEEVESQGNIPAKRSYGIDIKAVPSGKKLSNINMLSGGEKALTSIALICAIIANNPSPFVVLDEVDAALDEHNSIRFVKILEELSSKTQFIAITHNRATMHQAKIIYGVTMNDDGISKLLSINFDKADELAG